MSLWRNISGNWRETSFITILLGIVWISLLRKIFDPDIWFHMVVGREVLRRMQVPDSEFYIYTRLGEPGEFHEWGFGAFYYLINQYSGHIGMAITNAAIGCGILLFLYLAARGPNKTEWWISLPVIGLVLWIVDLRLNFRPETWLYLFLAIEIFLLEKYLQHRLFLWLLPLPFLAWILSLGHPSALFLIGVFGIYALNAVLEETGSKLPLVVKFGGISLAMAAGAMLNPYGSKQLLLPLYFQGEELINSLTEDLPVLQTEYSLHFIVIAVVGLCALVFSPRRRLVDVILVGCFALLAFRYARNISLLGIVLFVPIKNAFDVWSGHISKIVKPGLVMMFAAFVGITGIILTGTGPLWGSGIYQKHTPFNNAILISKYVQTGNILNFFHLGNYLAWELDRPVFVDGRNFGNNLSVRLHDAVFRADSGWQNIIEQFDIKAIVSPVTLEFSGEIIPLVEKLEVDPEWILIGQEESGLLFLKIPTQEDIPRLSKSQIWEQALEELNVTMENYPDSPETYRSMSAAYRHLGNVAKQKYFLSKFNEKTNK